MGELSWSAKAWQIRDPFFYFAHVYPDYQGLRDLPEFQALLREMDAPAARNT
jgi:hypothetical protein